jgi:3-hydroxybutyrate dehydrogenase
MLKGRVAVVTGSTSGIGLAIADGLAAAGADVVLNGFGDAAGIERIRADLAHRHGVRALYSPADMSRTEDIERMIRLADVELGRLDILVNNAGIQHVAPIDEFPLDKLDAIISINLVAAFKTIRFALPVMKRNNWGRIVNVTSAHAHVASPFKSAYVAAKHGLLGLTKAVALEVAEQGITCNAVSPGYVLTPLVQKQIPDTAKARGISEEAVIRDVMLAAQPTRKFVKVEEIAATTVFLCSDAAASITGTSISVDGGWTAQ